MFPSTCLKGRYQTKVSFAMQVQYHLWGITSFVEAHMKVGAATMPYQIQWTKKTSKLQADCIHMLHDFFLPFSSVVAIYHGRKRSKKSSSSSPTIDMISRVSYQSLHDATDGFSINKLIGGSFGSIFMGSFESQEVVAIKVINLQIGGAQKSFVAECNALRNTKHWNLVKIITCCSSIDYQGNEFKALVYEYMVNGNLENWLHPTTENPYHPRILLIDQILNILIDIVSALNYLHYECGQPIIHCHLKTSNVLLDDNMVAHLSDFGLAKLLSVVEVISNE